MRKIAVVTVARSDFGIYLPILERICNASELQLQLVVAGMHLSSEFGNTVVSIESQGFEIASKVDMLLSSDTPEGVSKSIGVGIIGFAQEFARLTPDLLLVLGDRFEMYAAVVSVLPFGLPVAHIHGGELTVGAFDDALRHSITKLSHLHFVSTEDYARRVIQLGEEPWRVTVVGAPSLDTLRNVELYNLDDLNDLLECHLTSPPLIVTFHPVTLEQASTSTYVDKLIAALDNYDIPIVFTSSNADPGGRGINNLLFGYAQRRENTYFFKDLGTKKYFSLLNNASAMVGNSSSGIIEAASFRLPVVNIGSRQQGRVRGPNVIDVGYETLQICRGLDKALSSAFRRTLYDMKNPYGDGRASERIVNRLKEASLDDLLIKKRFHDLVEIGA